MDPLYACLRAVAVRRIPDPGCRIADPVPLGDLRTLDPDSESTRIPDPGSRIDRSHVLIARDFSPRIECHGASTVVLDVSGLGRLLGDAQAIGAELTRAAAGIPTACTIAVARSQTAARLLAIARPGLTVTPGDAAAATVRRCRSTACARFMEDEDARGGTAAARVQATAVRLEHVPAVGPDDAWRDRGAAADRSVRADGAGGAACSNSSLAVSIARRSCRIPVCRRFVQSMELEWPIDALEPLSFVFARLLDPLSAALERADRGAAALRLDLRLVDRTTHTRVLQLPAAMRDPKVLRTLLLLDLESHPPSRAIDIVTIEIDPVPGRIVQYSLLERALPSPETLATLTARLSALVGDTPMRIAGAARHVASGWIRDAALCTVPLPASSSQLPSQPSSAASEGCLAEARRHAAARPGTSHPGHAVPSHSPLPSSDRYSGDRRTRPADPGGDRSSRDARRAMSSGPRVRGARQAPGGTRLASAWDRDEWDAALSDGSVCRLFRDRITDGWFLDGVLD